MRSVVVALVALTALLFTAGASSAAISRHSTHSPRYGQRTLALGSRGSDVKQLQTYLTDLGLRTPADGVFGPSTAKSVKAFQVRAGQRPDGKVTPAEARLIQRLVLEGADGTSLGPFNAQTYSGAPPAPPERARLSSDGRTAIAPPAAPQEVKDTIAAANQITRKPYRYGGGHGSFNDSAYDCSGAVSFALHGAGFLTQPLDSTQFMSWEFSGPGQWITVYTNHGHAYLVVAGLRFDTSKAGAPRGESGPRWRPMLRSSRGYVARHPAGF